MKTLLKSILVVLNLMTILMTLVGADVMSFVIWNLINLTVTSIIVLVLYNLDQYIA